MKKCIELVFDELEEKLIAHLSTELGINAVNVKSAFENYGLERKTVDGLGRRVTDMSFSLKKKKKKFEGAITITFGDQAENHVGMQKIGKEAKSGFSVRSLGVAGKYFEKKGYNTKLVNLNESLDEPSADEAAVLIVRNGVNALGVDADDMLKEQRSLEWDTKAKMYGRVVNKKARYNLCYSDFSQEPDYEEGKGRIVDFKDLPILSHIRAELGNVLKKAKNLQAEGNLYYDASACGIGWHSDLERKKVIAIRLGTSIPFHFHWFYKGKPVGERVELSLYHGDLYIMSEKAVGFDGRKRNIYTLRHAAGCKKFTTIKEKKEDKQKKETKKESKQFATRVRVKRKGGEVVQDCDVYVGRKCTMGGWRLKDHELRNPYVVGKGKHTLEESLKKYEKLMRKRLKNEPEKWVPLILELEGKSLGCFCDLKNRCHVDIIIKLGKELKNKAK